MSHATESPSPRIEWLDGARALAALFVVAHHAWAMTVGGYPGNNGPWGTDFLVYGHLAVSVFIVISGYSLALRPSRHGGRLKEGSRAFFAHRFWRIVPPFWFALAFASVLVVTGVVGSVTGAPYGWRDIAIHGLLLQDTFENTPPNGAFWSIAVEWHIYFLFPLVLWFLRARGAVVVAAGAVGLVVAQHVLAGFVPVIALFDRYTPQFFALFVLGVGAAHLQSDARARRVAPWLGVIGAAAIVCLIALLGPQSVTANYFWVDLLVGCVMAATFLALSSGHFSAIRSVLAGRSLTGIGKFAYSIYLIHAPILAAIVIYVVRPTQLPRGTQLWILIGLGMPAVLAGSYAFYLVCERPFVRFRQPRSAPVPVAERTALDTPGRGGQPVV